MDEKVRLRRKRHVRVRAKVSGSAERPRLHVFRSLKNIHAHLIDDEANNGSGHTLAAASSAEKDLRAKSGGNIEAAKAVGALIAQRAVDKGIKRVVFDRGGNQYHGRIKELADAARGAGLEF